MRWLYILLIAYAVPAFTKTVQIDLSQGEVELVRQDPTVIRSLFEGHREEILDGLGEIGASADDQTAYVVYCSYIAHRMATYGGCRQVTLDGLLHAPTLHCGSYSILTWMLAEAGWPEIFSRELALLFAGFRGPAFATHGFLFLERNGESYLMLDPTIGYVVPISFEKMVASRPMSSDLPLLDGGYWVEQPNVSWQRKRVYRTLTQGRVTRDQVKFCYRDLDFLSEGK